MRKYVQLHLKMCPTAVVTPHSYFQATVQFLTAEFEADVCCEEVIVPLHNNDNVPAETSSIETLPDTRPVWNVAMPTPPGACVLIVSLHPSL